MKKVCFVTPCELPVPAVYGGAIETLITMLIEENELEKKAEFVVVSNYVEEAAKIAEQYKYTKMVYLNRGTGLEKFMDEKVLKAVRYPIDLFRKGIRKLFKIELKRFPEFDWFVYRRNFYLKKMEADYIIVEGGNYYSFQKLSKVFGRKRMCLHVHHELFADERLEKIFGNVIGVSEFAKKQYLSTLKNPDVKGFVLFNCVDEKVFDKKLLPGERQRIRKSFSFGEEDFVVLFCGRITQVKGVIELIQAVQRINNIHIKLLIIGSVQFALGGTSDYYCEMLKLIAQTTDRIKYAGYVSNKDLYKYYQACDLQVVPSLWEEVAGLVTIEGMMSGLPLIITDSGGMVEYVDKECAIEVERNDELVNNMSHYIQELYINNDKRLKMANNACCHSKKYTKKGYYNNFIEIIHGI